jgi:nucleoside-diphosphate-sugar epimerase
MKGSHMQTKNVVMVAGAHGVSGRAAAEHWTRKPGTQVFGLSRRTASLPPGVQGITADLLDRKGLEEKIGRIKGVTHIVFAAYIEKPTAVERSHLGLPLRFPGTEKTYNALYQITSADILASATVWAGTRYSTSRTAITSAGDISGRASPPCFCA